MYFIIIIIILIILIYISRNPTEFLLPFNLLIENIEEKKVFYTEEEKLKIFPTSKVLEENWITIRNECIEAIKDKKLDNVGKQFIIENDNFWKGWTTFQLRMFSKDYEDNMKLCPILSQILKSDSNITTAFFSIMEPGKFLSSHYGPFKGILRYHMGLVIPHNAGPCYISVDGETYDWKEGEGILFDETYKHFVENSTPYYRIVLFLDVKRPLPTPLCQLNELILYLMSISPYNL